MKLNRVEKWLVKQAYPEIDFDTLRIVFCNSWHIVDVWAIQNSRYGSSHKFEQKEYDLREYVYQVNYIRDYAEFIHYAIARFHWDNDRNVLYYKIGSFKRGRELVSLRWSQTNA